MKQRVSVWQMWGLVFAGVLGTLLHFFFDWTGGNAVAALFSAVNESIWEHMKLVYYPMLIFAFIEYSRWGKEIPQFWCMKLIGILTGLLLIPMLYYTYTGIVGVSADWLNIAIFFFAAGAAFYLETKLFEKGRPCHLSPDKAFILLCMIGIVFTVFTFATPKIPFFRDPLTGTYGFQK